MHRANRKLETCFLTGGNQIRKDKSSFRIAYWPTIQSTWYTTTSLTINSYIHCQNISFYIVHWYKYNVWKMQNPTRKLCRAPGLSVLHFQLFNFLSPFYHDVPSKILFSKEKDLSDCLCGCWSYEPNYIKSVYSFASCTFVNSRLWHNIKNLINGKTLDCLFFHFIYVIPDLWIVLYDNRQS